MRNFILSLALVLALAVPVVTLAATTNSRPTVNSILNDITSSQNITTLKSLDCSKVTNEQFRSLGDALIAVMNPDPDQQQLMEQMMGGAGSASLQAREIIMGQQYLSCGGYGMMGSWGFSNSLTNPVVDNTLGNSRYSMMGWPMMGYAYGSGLHGLIFGGLLMIVFWVLIILLIARLLRFLLGSTRGAKNSLEILKQRYAKGDISKKEYSEMKKEIK